MSLKEQINNTVSLEMRILIYSISIMKIYILHILYNRLKRNMNADINLEKEKQMNYWIYNVKGKITDSQWNQ